MADDDEPAAGDAVYLGDVVSNAHLYGVVGPPGPPGPPGPAGPSGQLIITGTADVTGTAEQPVLTYSGEAGDWVLSLPQSGTRAAPEWFHRFTMNGWEYTFASKDTARKVRDELVRMTLEGEL